MTDKEPITEEHTFQIDGKLIKVFCGVSGDRRHMEYVFEGKDPLTPLDVAKILEVCSSNLMKGVKIERPVYAEEMN